MPPKPNLFDYATKELSLDAVICWFIAWALTDPADEHDGELCQLGRAFVDAILAKHGATLSWDDFQRLDIPGKAGIYPQETVVIDRKRHSMDVLAYIDDGTTRHVLLIEDKIDGGGDTNQQNRYYEILTEGRVTKLGQVPDDQVRAIYLATGNQSSANVQRIEHHTPFKVFGRNDFLEVLETYPGNHPVVNDFKSRLQQWEQQTNRFSVWTRDEDRKYWSWKAWQGLYLRLETEVDVVGWGYVPRGDFLGLWWRFLNVASEHAEQVYLQLEVKPGNPSYQKLCFKTGAAKDTDNAQKKAIRDECLRAVLDIGGHRVARPPRLGVGNTMTVAIWASDWLEFRDDGLLDIESTVANLREAENIIYDASLQL